MVECAVVGHEQNGLTSPGPTSSSEAPVEDSALQAFVRERLAGHKVPGLVTFVDELPKTPSGKIDRRSLRA